MDRIGLRAWRDRRRAQARRRNCQVGRTAARSAACARTAQQKPTHIVVAVALYVCHAAARSPDWAADVAGDRRAPPRPLCRRRPRAWCTSSSAPRPSAATTTPRPQVRSGPRRVRGVCAHAPCVPQITRSAAAPFGSPGESSIVVVRSPRSGANFWDLGAFDEAMAAARGRWEREEKGPRRRGQEGPWIAHGRTWPGVSAVDRNGAQLMQRRRMDKAEHACRPCLPRSTSCAGPLFICRARASLVSELHLLDVPVTAHQQANGTWRGAAHEGAAPTAAPMPVRS